MIGSLVLVMESVRVFFAKDLQRLVVPVNFIEAVAVMHLRRTAKIVWDGLIIFENI